MVEVSATPATLAARYNVTEQAVQWLLDNRGGGGDADTTALLQRLYRGVVAGAVESGAFNLSSPWEDTLVYDGLAKSMHITFFGTAGGGNAVLCQDGKGFYSRVFSDSENRWSLGSTTGATKSLADEVFGVSDTGYLEQIRSSNARSLAQAVFKVPSNIDSNNTIIDRIAAVQNALDELSINFTSTTTSLQNQTDHLNDRIDDLESRINSG